MTDLQDDIKILKTINNIIELIEKCELAEETIVDETIQLGNGKDSIISARDLYASRNHLCIKHEIPLHYGIERKFECVECKKVAQ